MKTVTVFNDPIHDSIYFDKNNEVEAIALRLIDTPFFQRLRRIRQLGLAETVYPSATHTRFSHSLGVFHLARRWCRYMSKYRKNYFNHMHEKVFLLAALLHDIGHGPLSHVSESIFHGFDHEHFSRRIVREDSDINHVLGKEVDIENLVKVLEGPKPKEEYEYGDDPYYDLHFMLSSDVDVDRLDYLARDSHYSGVAYGSVDVDRIMWCSEPSSECRFEKMRFANKGVVSLSQYLAGRYFMYRSVYMHPRIKAAETQLKEILCYAHKNSDFMKKDDMRRGENQLGCLLSSSGGDVELKDYYFMDDEWLLGIIEDMCFYYKEKEDPKLKRWIDSFLNRDLWCMDLYYCDETISSDLQKEIKELRDEKYDEEYYCDVIPLKDKYYQPYLPKSTKTPIFIVSKDGRENKLGKDELLLRYADEHFNKTIGVCYEDDEQLKESVQVVCRKYIDKEYLHRTR